MNLIENNLEVKFETERLLLKRCEPEFTDALFDAAKESVQEVYPFLPWCHPEYKREEAKQWLTSALGQWENKSAYSFSIFHRKCRRLIGGCGLYLIDENPVANLGYWIRSGDVGKGFATEATLGLAAFAFRHLGLLRIEIIMSIKNLASRQVAINAGALYEGTLKNRLLLHGEGHNAYLYSLFPDMLDTP